MAEYSTEQKKILLDFLNEHSEAAYEIDTLSAELNLLYGEHAPGKSTVYRLVSRLYEDGQLRRLPKTRGRGYLYQIIKSEDCHSHLHMKCMDCGRLLHLEQGLSKELLRQVQRSSSFSVSQEETVLFGRCADCKITKN